MEALDRLLELARRELGGVRARLEYAATPPPGDAVLWTAVADGWRVVIDYAAPPEDAAGKQEQLDTLARSFDHVVHEARTAAPSAAGHDAVRVGHELRDVLDALAERTHASAIWVIDDRSPIVWGASSAGTWLSHAEQARTWGAALEPLDPDDVLRWLDGQELPPPPAPLARVAPALRRAIDDVADPRARLVTFAALAGGAARTTAWSTHLGGTAVMSRPFSAIYRVVALFEPDFSELHAQTTLTRALPVIERLIAEHPPIDPTPQGARIHAFRRPD